MPYSNRNSGAKRRGGFVLLYAVMTASIILAVGVSILSIAFKQLSISTLGRESQYAFYAANTGAECALYWDFHGILKPVPGLATSYDRMEVFANPFSGGTEISAADAPSIQCARTAFMVNPAPSGRPADDWSAPGCSATECASTFTIFLGRLDDGSGGIDYEGACARVTVEKMRGRSVTCPDGSGTCFQADSTASNLQTTIDSRGYNYCDEANSRRVERGLRFTY